MVKFGKTFRSNQIKEFKEKYLNYKSFKQLIKTFLNNNSNIDNSKKNEILNNQTIQFTEKLDKEIRKVYIFFINQEKNLYKKINSHLYSKKKYNFYDLKEFLTEFYELNEISKLTLNLSNFVFYNLKAVMKILKKFDKKIIKNKENFITKGYIQNRLEDNNSNILYLFYLKIIDEVNVLMEDLNLTLKKNYENNKNFLKKKNYNKKNNNKSNLLLESEEENLPKFSVINKKINSFYYQINLNMKTIDKVTLNLKNLFVDWNDYLKINSEISSKLYFLNKNQDFNNRSSINSNLSSINENNSKNNNNNNNILSDFKNYLKFQSIINNINLSKENSYNIYLIIIHGFLYMFSFIIIIPTNLSLIHKNNENKNNIYIINALIMFFAPFGTLLSFIYELKWFSKNTKQPFIFSFFIMIVGNILYSIKTEKIFLMFLGRFLIGLSNIRTSNKMYLTNFVPKNDVNKFLNYFNISSTLGIIIGFLVNYFFIEIFENKNDFYFDAFNIGNLFCIIFCVIFLIFSLMKYSNAYDKNFRISNMIFNNNNNEIDFNGENRIVSDEENKNEDFNENILNDTKMVEDIDEQLEKVNEINNFNDTNLVTKSIFEISEKEKKGLNYLYNSFVVYLIIIFSSKLINECLIVIFPFFDFDSKNNKINLSLFCLIFSFSFLVFLLLLELFEKIEKCLKEKKLLIIILFLLFISNLMNIFAMKKKVNLFFIINIFFSVILSRLSEIKSSIFFSKIIPNDYILCKIQGNSFINYFSTFGRIFGSFFPIFFISEKVYLIIFSILSSFSFVSFCLFFCFYGEIRIKAISRIIKEKEKNKYFEILTEI